MKPSGRAKHHDEARSPRVTPRRSRAILCITRRKLGHEDRTGDPSLPLGMTQELPLGMTQELPLGITLALAVLVQKRSDVRRQRQVVGDARNPLRLPPRRLQLRELAFHRAALGFLV